MGQLRRRHRAGQPDRDASRHRRRAPLPTAAPASASTWSSSSSSDLGFFCAGGLPDGRFEPYEFTDIDSTIAAGFVLSGKRWGRPDDTSASRGVINGISHQHEAFLNAGGLGILVGDGKLPQSGNGADHRGLLQLSSLESWRVTLDYQFADNPAYNRDRGPVSVFCYAPARAILRALSAFGRRAAGGDFVLVRGEGASSFTLFAPARRSGRACRPVRRRLGRIPPVKSSGSGALPRDRARSRLAAWPRTGKGRRRPHRPRACA